MKSSKVVSITDVEDAQKDFWRPTFTGTPLEEVRKNWLADSQQQSNRRFVSVDPLQSVAIVGAVRDHETGRLNIRDQIACRAIMSELLPCIPMAPNCTVDLYNRCEGKDIYATDKRYGMVIFCNIAEYAPNGEDQSQPSDIWNGKRQLGIAPEHQYYVTISDHAKEADSYKTLATKLNARFIATWGFVHNVHVDADHIASPAIYDLSRSPGQRLLQRGAFTNAAYPFCNFSDLHTDAEFDSNRAYMKNDSVVSFSVRNDEFEKIAVKDREMALQSPLFDCGVLMFEKMELLARIRQDRGRAPVASSRSANSKSLEKLQALVQRPLTRMEQTEKFLRRFIHP